MSGSVWTASVWGNGAKAAMISSSLEGKLQEGEEECMICRGDVGASVSLKPCNHSVCLACVEKMRASNIFKPDKGVKCPFCRSYVERYQPTNSSMNNPTVKEIVSEANRAATVAANARIAQFAPPQQQRPPPAPVTESNWLCTHCGNQNWPSRLACNICKKPNTSPNHKFVQQKFNDVLKCTPDEIMEFVKTKLHPGLNKAFQDAGVPFSMNTVQGSQEQILAAMRNRGEERLCKVVSVLAASGKLPESAVHFFGNYTIQDLLVATAKLRAATSAPSHKFMLDGFRAQHDGKDPFGLLHTCLLEGCESASKHQQGTYVIQKAIELGDCEETVRMSNLLLQQGMHLASDQKGVFVIIKALGQMATFLTPQTAPAIQEVVEPLAAQMLRNFDKTKYLGYHQLSTASPPPSGKILVEVLQTALPAPNSLQLGLRLANTVRDFTKSSSGLYLVVGLLNLRPILPETAEILRDMTCMIAMALRGDFIKFLVGEDPKGQEMVSTIIERLADEQEVIWVDAITAELVSRGDLIVGNEQALETLKYALSTNVYDPETVGAHLDHLAALVGDVTPIAEDVCARMQNAPPPAPPKYMAPSYVQPDLQYVRDADGVPHPLPEQQPARPMMVKQLKGKAVKEKGPKQGKQGKQQRGSYAGEERPQGTPKGKSLKMGPRSVSDSEVSHLTNETSFGALSLEDSSASLATSETTTGTAASSSGFAAASPPVPAPMPTPTAVQPAPEAAQPVQAAGKAKQLTNKQQQWIAKNKKQQGNQVPPPPPTAQPAPAVTAAHTPASAPVPVAAHAHAASAPPPVHVTPLPPAPLPTPTAAPPPPAVPQYHPLPTPGPSYQPPVSAPYMPPGLPSPSPPPPPSYRPLPVPHPPITFGTQVPPYRPISPQTFVATPIPPYAPHQNGAPSSVPMAAGTHGAPVPIPAPVANGHPTHPPPMPRPVAPAPRPTGVPRPAPRPVAPHPAGPANGFAMAAAPRKVAQSWKCIACTYEHAGPEANFLACAICGTERGGA